MATVAAEPFTIAVPDEVLEDLRARLRATRWPDKIAGAGWDDGADVDYMRELIATWADDYDWRAQERALNELDHQRATLDGLPIHFVLYRGSGEPRLPLLLTHGWPSSFLEYRKLAPRLVEAGFDVVTPSLPGYGFSGRPDRNGVVGDVIADLWHRLMTEVLGYERYAAHGTDIGAGVTWRLGARHPDAVAAIHLSAASFLTPPEPADPPLTQAERDFDAATEHWDQTEGGYIAIQATKPQTLGHGLTDSPAGMAAWIIEKWRSWSDCGGDLESRFTRDEILTTLTLYWVTATINSSIRLYYESRRHGRPTAHVDVPTGIALFHNEFVREPEPPRELVERTHNVVHWCRYDRGGHFPALEEPELLADDISDFFTRHA